MVGFDDIIKTEFSEFNTPSDIEAALDTMHRFKTGECDGIGLSPVSKLPAQMLILVPVGLRRAIDRRTGTVRPLILTALGTLATSCNIIVATFETFAARIEGLAVLAEREIYEGGTWPAGESYPVVRN